jgi:hypothetical protein
MNQDTQLLTVVTGAAVPLLVGLITKSSASAGLKAFTNLILTAIGTALALIIPVGFEWKPFFIQWFQAFAISAGTYYGFYKPSGIAPAVNNSTGNVGLG